MSEQLNTKNERKKCSLLPERVKIAIMSFLAITILSILRSCFSVAITQMVLPGNNKSGTVCQKELLMPDDSKFNWTTTQQGLLLSSYYIGYVLSHVPGGILAEAFGGKWTLALGILSGGFFTLLTPVAARYGGYIALFISRIFVGLSLGTTFPAIIVLLAAWIPENERSEIGSFVFGGVQIGVFLGYFVSGVILDNLAWDYVFYIWSIVSLVWFVIFIFCSYSDPASDPELTNKERDYLESHIGHLKRSKGLPPTPWRDMIKSRPLLALISVNIGHDWCAAIMNTHLPTYNSDVLGFDILDVGLFSALPYLVMWIVSLASGLSSDCLIAHEIISITLARKIFLCGAIFTGTFIMIASYAECDQNMAIIWFSIAIGFMGVYYSHVKINALDLGPNYAGVLMALSNGMGAVTASVSPLFASYMTPNTSLEEYRMVFFVTFCIYLVTTFIFVIGADGNVQLWNYPKEWEEPEGDVVHDIDRNSEKKST